MGQRESKDRGAYAGLLSFGQLQLSLPQCVSRRRTGMLDRIPVAVRLSVTFE
jgi:hypothetical protein